MQLFSSATGASSLFLHSGFPCIFFLFLFLKALRQSAVLLHGGCSTPAAAPKKGIASKVDPVIGIKFTPAH
jgi:hypothetical protein